MIKKLYIQKYAILFFIFISNTSVVIAGEHILVPKFGAVERNDNSNHSVDNNSFDLDDDVVAGLGFTYLYKLDDGVALGVDTFWYENEIIKTINNNGDVTTGHVYGIVEKIFNLGGNIKPFIGVGIGMVSMSFDASVNGKIGDDYEDTLVGLSYEIFVGTEVEVSKKIGVTVEYKYFDFEVDNDIDDREIEIESDGHALFMGVAIHL